MKCPDEPRHATPGERPGSNRAPVARRGCARYPMRKGAVIGWSIIVLGIVLMLLLPHTHLLDVQRRAPETQHDGDEMWEHDATQWRHTLVFFIGAGIVAVGIFVLRNYGGP